MMRLRLAALLSVLFAVPGAAQPVEPEPLSLTMPGGQAMFYYQETPAGFDAKKPVPVFVALPPGPGTRRMALAAMDMLGRAAAARGYLAVAPEARAGLYYKGSAPDVLVLLDDLARRYTIDTTRVVIGGVSNGGLGAVHVASRWPERFAAVVGAPGAWAGGGKLQALIGLPLWLRVGGNDHANWVRGATALARGLSSRGGTVSFEVVAGQGHVVPIDYKALFDWLDARLAARPTSVRLTAADGVQVTGDLYSAGDDKTRPVVLLCHQARSSRGEYRPIAPRLVSEGFHCLAIDQRSGSAMNGIANRTAAALAKAGTAVSYRDAIPDLEAGVAWLRANGYSGKLTLWGSSYSAALALIVGGRSTEVAAVVSCSPGDYLQPPGSLFTDAAAVKGKPVLILAPESERAQAELVVESLGLPPAALVVTGGVHGAKMLYAAGPQAAAPAWTAVKAFLARHGR